LKVIKANIIIIKRQGWGFALDSTHALVRLVWTML